MSAPDLSLADRTDPLRLVRHQHELLNHLHRLVSYDGSRDSASMQRMHPAFQAVCRFVEALLRKAEQLTPGRTIYVCADGSLLGLKPPMPVDTVDAVHIRGALGDHTLTVRDEGGNMRLDVTCGPRNFLNREGIQQLRDACNRLLGEG